MRRKNGMREFQGIYEVGVYPRKTDKNGTVELFAYLVPANPENRKIVKITKLKEVDIYQGKKLMEKYTGKAPARTIRMNNGDCTYDGEKLICKTDDIMYMKKRGRRR